MESPTVGLTYALRRTGAEQPSVPVAYSTLSLPSRAFWRVTCCGARLRATVSNPGPSCR